MENFEGWKVKRKMTSLYYNIKTKGNILLKNRTRNYRSISVSRYESVHKDFKQNINRMGKEGIAISKYE